MKKKLWTINTIRPYICQPDRWNRHRSFGRRVAGKQESKRLQYFQGLLELESVEEDYCYIVIFEVLSIRLSNIKMNGIIVMTIGKVKEVFNLTQEHTRVR